MQTTKNPLVEETAPSTRSGSRFLRSLLRQRETGLVAIIIVLFIVMSFASPYFLTWPNIKAMLMSFSIEGIVVVGMTVLLIVGGLESPRVS